MYQLFGTVGKMKFWDYAKVEIEHVEARNLEKFRAMRALIALTGLQQLAHLMPLHGPKHEELRDIWVRLGGTAEACPKSEDSFSSEALLAPLAQSMGVETESVKKIRRKYAILPEEKALLTYQGNHKQLIKLTDIALLIMGGPADAAAHAVQKIVKQDYNARSLILYTLHMHIAF
jgi:hypothetical protein